MRIHVRGLNMSLRLILYIILYDMRYITHVSSIFVCDPYSDEHNLRVAGLCFMLPGIT